ncbi:MAG: DNA cytosine methyltransferase, partial [Pseudomonadaceae bacterium]
PGEVHAGKLAHHDGERQQQVAGQGFRTDTEHDAQSHGGTGRLGDDDHEGLEGLAGHGDGEQGRPQPTGSITTAGAVNGFWANADWLACRDGKWRPVEPGTFPLAHGAPARVGRLRAYGNAIVAQVAQEVIGAYMECRP